MTMTIIELAKEILELYSEARTFTMTYSKKILFKKVFPMISYDNTNIGNEQFFDFIENKKIINDLNKKILDKNFNINITFSITPLSTISIELIKILISKLAHLDRDMSFGYIDEKEKNKLLKNNDFNTLFYNYLKEYLRENIEYHYSYSSYVYKNYYLPSPSQLNLEQEKHTMLLKFSNNLNIEIESSTHPLSKSEGILMTYATIFCNISNTKSTGNYKFEIDYIKSNTIDIPLFRIYEKQDEIQKIIKELCPILLKIGDIENFLKLS